MLASLPFVGDSWMPREIAGDLSFLLLFFGVSLAVGFFFGRWKLINILINTYIALAFVGIIPNEWFGVSPYAPVGFFLFLLVFLSAIDERLFDLHITSAGTDFFWRLFVMSGLVTGLLASAILNLSPRSLVVGLASPNILSWFGSEAGLVFWMTFPLLVLLFINRRLR